MSFFEISSRFARDEDGAVTVDWVVLTAGIVILAIVVIGAIESSLTNTATEIAAVVDSVIT